MARLPEGWRVAAVPFALSLALSLSTVGRHAFWQDSAAYLLAVKDLGILYPHGFVLYLLLCKAWTTLFFFLDPTLAVHLFSSACAAASAGVVALAARAWLRSRGEAFRVDPASDAARADGVAAGVGCLAACGYTFWFAGIYAKGYSLLFLLLSLVLWAMIRADESRRPRDLTILAALIGLSWAAHPAATLLGPAFVLYVFTQRRTVGLGGIAARTGLAALCALGPVLLLPILAAREPGFMMGDPRTPADLLEYLLGSRFTGKEGHFGVAPSRFRSFPLYFWEEFLGVGTILVGLGLIRLARQRPSLLAGLAAWAVPYSLVTLLFKIEGQHDCWLVAVWLPLHLTAGWGLDRLAGWAGPRSRLAVGATVLAAAAWSIGVNRPLLNQRGYALAEEFAAAHLDNLDRGAIFLMEGDDLVFLCDYAQRVRERRLDVVLVSSPHLGQAGGWYERKLIGKNASLRFPDYAGTRSRFPGLSPSQLPVGAFVRANADGGRALFLQESLPDEALPEGYALVPAGRLWKLQRRDDPRINLGYWSFPREPEALARSLKRKRGQALTFGPGKVDVEPETYERRYLLYLLGARATLADLHLNRGEFPVAAAAYESLIALEPWYARDAETAFALAIAYRGMGRDADAETSLQRVLVSAPRPTRAADALLALAEIHLKRGDAPKAEECRKEALRVPGLTPSEVESIRRRRP